MAGSARLRAITPATALSVSGYAVLGFVLVWSRMSGLGWGYTSDELRTLARFASAGPREILAGAYLPNNHELFSLLGWATIETVGDSAVGLRLWSAVPFVVGVIVATTWLHVRVGRLSALLFLFFATFSPLLLDITRQARGYGLAFLAMAVLVVAALEAERTGGSATLALFCGAGVVGTWTLPHFAVAFLATGVVLAANRRLRRRAAIGLAASALAILAWYAPHLDDIAQSSQQDYALPIEAVWLPTAPIDQILTPALADIDDALVDPGVGSLTIALALALLIGSSSLLRSRTTALVLVTGVLATILAFWATSTNVAPRFLSYLLVPVLILLATGTASILTRFVESRRPLFRTLLAVSLLGVFTVVSVDHLQRIVRLPRDATRDVADAIRDIAPASTPVFAYIPYPEDLESYLGRRVELPGSRNPSGRICDLPVDAILVTQSWLLLPADFPCTRRPRAEHYVLEQYARGGRMDVWIIPPAA